jgi:hypothetical protein
MKLYVNGDSVSDTTSVILAPGPQSFQIGKSSSYSGFAGSIDDIRIYNTTIPVSQIKEQYYTGLNNLLITEG